jgi:hypothetical protein
MQPKARKDPHKCQPWPEEAFSTAQGERQPALHKVGAGGRRSLAPADGWLIDGLSVTT